MHRLVIVLLLAVPAFAKQQVSIEVLESSQGNLPIGWQVPGSVVQTGNYTSYSAPVMIPYRAVWIKATVDGRNAILSCNDAMNWHCMTLAPGSYEGELKGDHVRVTGWNFDHSKSKKIKYKIVGAW